ncbi:hypothetical protein HGP14_25140 [Rhizobium sp. P32RR-XVIII]|uniref:hypothetical protein n=1 Tax=Rhizobium sp. P32RR-XVIII TaxID=2726738 RepID=UPI0014572906|nr:hypothetical protein [Rhizobium sp. P32RR-XVIII]NLS06599.1 hypothetical protein [Rhizobium sp. P32RR-XVIII]
MRELKAVDLTSNRYFEAVEFGYVRKVFLEDEACWGLFDSEGDVIFVGDDPEECQSFAAKEEIRIQTIH